MPKFLKEEKKNTLTHIIKYDFEYKCIRHTMYRKKVYVLEYGFVAVNEH